MPLTGEDWASLWDSFEREAFRLETLPVYKVAGEEQALARFLATGKQHLDADDEEWLSTIRLHRTAGRTVGRVHVVTRPLTDYLRFEFAFYAHSVRAGEDIRILDVTDKPDPGLSRHDFWMFDESKVVRMDYADDGTYLGDELLEVNPARYVEWKRIALDLAEPFTEYAARWPHEPGPDTHG